MTDRREVEKLVAALQEKGHRMDVLQDAEGRISEIQMDGQWYYPLSFAEKARPMVNPEDYA